MYTLGLGFLIERNLDAPQLFNDSVLYFYTLEAGLLWEQK
jgi:hypothetical protein